MPDSIDPRSSSRFGGGLGQYPEDYAPDWAAGGVLDVKGLGNYRFASSEERRAAILLQYRGLQALIRFHNGPTFAIPAKSLREMDIKPQTRIIIIIKRLGKKIQDIRVESYPEARPARPKGATPKIMLRAGRRLITRR